MSTLTGVHEIKLRELESLLRRKFGPDLILLNQITNSLLPPGENYGSTMLKVQAIVKRNKNNETKEEEKKVLELVAKMLPATDFQRHMFDSPFTFKKETFLYESLIPAYRQLERDFGVPDDELFDVLPEFFGARYSLTSDDDQVDDDAVILMQNLKAQGYYNADRLHGLDLQHAKIAITAIARFHSLGIAMKHHRPDFFEIIKHRSKCLTIKDMDFEKPRLDTLNLMRNDPILSKYYTKLEAALSQESATNWTAVPPEPWSTIVHMDLWINNIMFHKNYETGQLDNVKFVDFQNYLFLSPLRELTFFLSINLQTQVMDNKFDELIDFYYSEFIKTLKKMKCSTDEYRRDKFDERLKIDGFEEFPHCPFMIKIMSAENSSSDIKEQMMGDTINQLYIDRLRRCVDVFVKKGWL